ncbi:MAG TPA: hypothetical protein VJK02_15440, partial [Anaerolineales bacterium]|nr:hypothetical protein [Anaerolineales bacterium]
MELPEVLQLSFAALVPSCDPANYLLRIRRDFCLPSDDPDWRVVTAVPIETTGVRLKPCIAEA